MLRSSKVMMTTAEAGPSNAEVNKVSSIVYREKEQWRQNDGIISE